MNLCPAAVSSNARYPSPICSYLRPGSTRLAPLSAVNRGRQPSSLAVLGDVYETTSPSRRGEHRLPPGGDVTYNAAGHNLNADLTQQLRATDQDMRWGTFSKKGGYSVNVSAYLGSSTDTLQAPTKTTVEKAAQGQPDLFPTRLPSSLRSRQLGPEPTYSTQQAALYTDFAAAVSTVDAPRPPRAPGVRTLTRTDERISSQQQDSQQGGLVVVVDRPVNSQVQTTDSALLSSSPILENEASTSYTGSATVAPTRKTAHTEYHTGHRRRRVGSAGHKLRNEPELRFVLLMTGLNERTTNSIIEAARQKHVPQYPDVLSKRVLHLMSLYDSRSVGQLLHTCPGVLRYGNKRLTSMMQDFAQQLRVSLPEVLPMLLRQPSLFAYFVGMDVFCSCSIL